MNFGGEEENEGLAEELFSEIDSKEKRVGQSFDDKLEHRFRGSTLRPDQRFRAPAAIPEESKKSLRETMMPTFNISTCDHLGLLS